jgi:primosomal protein N' (replication factor Y)
LVARVLTDVAGIDKEFDYLVPGGQPVEVGSQVRVDLHGRRVGGWVTAVGIEPEPGLALRPIAKIRGWGPQTELVDLAGWAAWRWAGRRRSFLVAASADHAVPRLPPSAVRPPQRPAISTVSGPGARPTILRLPPAADPTSTVAELSQLGPTLVVVPTADRAAVLAGRLRQAGGDVALMPDGWRQARAGVAVVVGTRAAAWAPCPGLAACVVLDAHDEALGQEGAPTWNAVDVVVERARRAGARCVLISSCPTVELLALGEVVTVERGRERAGWAAIEVVDRRSDDPRLGLYSDRLVKLIRAEEKVLCVLNRKGRARLLACRACGELARCEACGAALTQPEGSELICPRCGRHRPQVCASCGSTRVKLLRVGVSRAREELEALAGRPVAELTASSGPIDPEAAVVVGTEAVLHRFHPADGIGTVAFIDFDQELLAPRVRAADEALGLLALASRLVRGRSGRVIVQTRLPDHPVIRAAVLADPEILAQDQAAVRQALQLPPFAAVAVVSGQGAAEYVDALRFTPVTVLGPDGDRWLVKAGSQDALSDALAAVERPAGPVRVAVDPARM